MENITIVEALGLSVVAITVVMIVLAGLMFIVEGFKYIGGDKPSDQVQTLSQPKGVPAGTALVEDEESKMVAVLTALIRANEDQQDKKYRIRSIKRIK
ncbi:OadG family protein [Streptococcus merionis]|uniref:OadG family protein n=1 Tax=Streptococcus merionis TaxID=400065 RepID=UPI0035133312